MWDFLLEEIEFVVALLGYYTVIRQLYYFPRMVLTVECTFYVSNFNCDLFVHLPLLGWYHRLWSLHINCPSNLDNYRVAKLEKYRNKALITLLN